MLNVNVGPLARHIIENIGDPAHAVTEIDNAIEEARPRMFTIEGKTKLHLHDRTHGYELTGFLHRNGYQIDETRVFIEQVFFPQSVMTRWDAELEDGTMPAARLIDIPTMMQRRVLGYQMFRDEGVTIFHLEEWDRSLATGWRDLREQIDARREPA